MTPQPDPITAPEPAPDHVPPVVAPPPGNPRFPLMDSMRGIAALSVVVVHAAILSQIGDAGAHGRLLIHLNIGVTIFFVISGFLLYRPFVAARAAQAPTPRIRDYARRRLLRIVPAYWLALTLLAIYPGLIGVFSGDWFVYYGFLQIYPFHDRVFCIQCGIPQAWSLAVEVTFYAALPAVALLLGRFAPTSRGPGWVRRELAILGALAAASVAFYLWASGSVELHPDTSAQTLPDRFALGQTLPGLFYWFAFGMALAVISVYMEGREEVSRVLRLIRDRPWVPWAAAISLYALLTLVLLPATPNFVVYSPLQRLGQAVLFGLIGALLLLPVVFGGEAGGLVRRVLAHPVLTWLGVVSYGIFLWNFTIMAEVFDSQSLTWLPGPLFIRLVTVAIFLGVICAAASYYLVERPILRFKYSSRDR